MKSIYPCFVLSFSLVLGGCGATTGTGSGGLGGANGSGGTGGTFGEVDSNPPVYGDFSTGEGQGTGTLGGAFMQGTGRDKTTSTGSGSIRFEDGATTLSDGVVTIVDSDGVSLHEELEDDENTHLEYTTAYIKSSGGNYLNNDYETLATVRVIDGVVTQTGNDVTESLGVVGFATDIANVPTAGSGTYHGEAWVRFESRASTVNIGTAYGDVAAVTDFDLGVIDLTISDIDDGANNTQVPVDTIKFLGLDIDGNVITGDSYQATIDGAPLEPSGAGSEAVIKGNLFGYDASVSGPDEMGGIFVIKGVDGTLDGLFGAD